MVTITAVEERTGENGPFNVIVLQGKLEVVKSETTGMPYLTARKSAIPFTFGLEYAKTLIGTQMPGEIERYDCPDYEIIIPGKRKKKLTLHHRYRYEPTPVPIEEVVG